VAARFGGEDGLLALLGEGGEGKMEFWAKTTTDGKPGISVFEHMINVGSELISEE